MTASITTWLGGLARRVPLPANVDQRGTLLPLDFDRLPFAPMRLVVVKDVPAGANRGGHAHRSSRQLLVCLSGEIDVELRTRTDGARLRLAPADGDGLLVEAGVWTAQTYGAGASLLLLASEPWRPASYSAQPLA